MIDIANSIKDGLFEVAKNIYISKSDPDFLKKYLQYNPSDNEKLYEYAEKLDAEGETIKAFEYYLKAADNGNLKARKVIERAAKAAEETKVERTMPVVEKKKSRMWPYYALLALFLAGLLVIMMYLLSNMFTLNKESTTNNYEFNNTTVNITENDEPTKKEELAFVVARSAIEYYQDINGEYPDGLWQLTRQTPRNYISNVPKTIEYQITDAGYKLSVTGIKTNDSMVDGLINLVFYEKENQLGILKGDELLALYDVASGAEGLPKIPTTSSVTKRVVNPNGGNGPLGTRGLQLTDNYAIHGTDEPDLIGGRVSQGCIRMLNEDIEKLYPYVPLGTPFKVDSENQPGKPTFSDGLPELTGLFGKGEFNSEKTPLESYNWKK